MPIQVPHWNEYLTCPTCLKDYNRHPRSPVNIGCGHTLCKVCVVRLNPKQCPFDQSPVSLDLDNLVINTALLFLCGVTPPEKPYHPTLVNSLSEADQKHYDVIIKSIEELAGYLKYNINTNCKLSKPMQRKMVNVIQCTIIGDEARGRLYRSIRSLAERTVTEIILQNQNPQQLGANLWAAVRARGCQFLGPGMQEEVLKLVLLALEDGSALSRKVLVMFVVQRLESRFPQASKTSIGHVVQLLYRASCFKVSKRESDSSLMQLKEEFRTYENLRREHDSQIVQIATEAGLRIAPDQWSSLLYGDPSHKSHMQSIIDKMQTPQSFVQSVQELTISYQRGGGDPTRVEILSPRLQLLTAIDPNLDSGPPTWEELSNAAAAVVLVVNELLQSMTAHRDINQNPYGASGSSLGRSSNTQPIGISPNPSVAQATEASNSASGQVPGFLYMPKNYKTSMCNIAAQGKVCFRGNMCLYAHSEEELELYRSMHRKKNSNKATLYNNPDYQSNHQYLGKVSTNGNVVTVQSHPSTSSVSSYQQQVSQPQMSSSSSQQPSVVRYPQSTPLSGLLKVAERTRNFSTQTVDNHQIPAANNTHVGRGQIVSHAPPVLHQSQQQPLLNVVGSKRFVPRNQLSVLIPPEGHGGTPINRQAPVTREDLQTLASVLELGGLMSHSILERIETNAQMPSRHNNNGPILVAPSQRDFVRSDSILTDDAECIPFDAQPNNTFGPISREHCRFATSTTSNSFATSTPNNSPHFHVSNSVSQQLPIYGAFNNLSQRQTRELMDAVQLDRLRRCINSEQQQHLQQQRLARPQRCLSYEELRNLDPQRGQHNMHSTSRVMETVTTRHLVTTTNNRLQNIAAARPQNNAQYEEDTYEEGIAKDIEELRLKWDSELREDEKLWASKPEAQ